MIMDRKFYGIGKGVHSRTWLPHVPFLVDKDVVQSIFNEFPKEVERTRLDYD